MRKENFVTCIPRSRFDQAREWYRNLRLLPVIPSTGHFFFCLFNTALQDAISLQAECEHTAEWENIQCNATIQRILLRETARQDDDLRRLA